MPRRKQDSPIESVELKVSLKADRETLLRIKRGVPEAVWRKGELEVNIRGKGPAGVLEETKSLSDRVRAALEG